MLFKRTQYQTLWNRLHAPQRYIQVVSGPRQTGKTTLVHQVMKELELPHHYASADAAEADGLSWIRQQWDTLRLRLENSNQDSAVLFLDEIQRIEQWSRAVKSEWDRDQTHNVNLKVVLLGSARLLIQEGLTESLAGRFEVLPMWHWTFAEMNEAFGLEAEEYVWFGGYPGPTDLIEDEERWKKYVRDALVEPTVSKDIFMLSRIHKPALLRRLFDLACSYSGQILSYNKMIGQLQDAGNTTTLAHYLELLDSAGLVSGLDKFYPAKVRQRGSSPKLQVQNTALISALTASSFQEVRRNPQEWGRWVESAVGAHLLSHTKQNGIQLYYWRHVNNEVDFVLTKGKQVIALEVKSGRMRNRQGMDAFNKRYHPDRLLLVGDNGMPWQEFLKINPADLFSR